MAKHVTTDAATGITNTSAYLNCTFYKDEAYDDNYICFYFGTDPDLSEFVVHIAGDVTEDGTMSHQVTDLVQGTTYYFQAWFNGNDFPVSGEILSFVAESTLINRANSIKDLTTLEAIRNVELSAGGGRAYVDAEGKFRYESRFGRGI